MASKLNHHSSHFILILLFITLALSSRPVAAQSSQPMNSNSQKGLFNSTNFTPSISIILIVLVVSFFLLGFLSFYARYCATERILEDSLSTPNHAMNRKPRGLDPAIVESFPTMTYSDFKEHKVGKGAVECAVCLSEFENDEKMRLLPKCSHAFHPDCIKAWLAGHVTCPVCRCNLMVYKNVGTPSAGALTVNDDSTPETSIQITLQEEERPGDRPAVPADAMVIEVKTETAEEQKEREEVTELERIRQALRSKSSRRSHSTGTTSKGQAQAGLR